MDTKHYRFPRYTNFKKKNLTTNMNPDLKPSGRNSAFPFPTSYLQQNHLSSASSVFTFANFRMYFYSLCVTQVSKLLLPK